MSLPVFVTLAALVTLAVAQDLTVNTPSSAQACLPVAISWTGGAPPVYVSLIPGGQPGGTIIKDFGAQTTSPLTWNVDQPAGTSVTVQIRDNSGKLNYSDKFTIQPSTQTCKTGDAGAAGGAAGPGKPGATPPPAVGGNTTKAGTPTTSPSPPGASGTPAAGTSNTPSSSSNTAATASSTPASQAASDASRTIPGFFALAMVGALAIFA